MAEKDHYKSVASLVLGAVSASLVLLPSVLGVVAKPLSDIWTLWVYLGTGFCALIAMAFTYYVAAFTTWPLPVRASGVGLISSVICILFFGIFLFLNLLSDQVARPVITSLTSGAIDAAPGEAVSLAAHGEDQNGDRLHWIWRITPDAKLKKSRTVVLPSHLESAVWRISDQAELGTYTVSATVSDGHDTSTIENLVIEVRRKP